MEKLSILFYRFPKSTPPCTFIRLACAFNSILQILYIPVAPQSHPRSGLSILFYRFEPNSILRMNHPIYLFRFQFYFIDSASVWVVVDVESSIRQCFQFYFIDSSHPSPAPPGRSACSFQFYFIDSASRRQKGRKKSSPSFFQFYFIDSQATRFAEQHHYYQDFQFYFIDSVVLLDVSGSMYEEVPFNSILQIPSSCSVVLSVVLRYLSILFYRFC